MASACLLGVPCRYDGRAKESPDLRNLFNKGTIVPFCPEVFAGLGIPRPKAHLTGTGEEVLKGSGKVFDEQGNDLTGPFINGAKKTLALATLLRPSSIVLKSKSPSCGVSTDIVQGVTAALLARSGFNLAEVE